MLWVISQHPGQDLGLRYPKPAYGQTPHSRFEEIFAEIFVAGSDLSQQIGQAHGAFQYLRAKNTRPYLAGRTRHGRACANKNRQWRAMQRQGGIILGWLANPPFPILSAIGTGYPHTCLKLHRRAPRLQSPHCKVFSGRRFTHLPELPVRTTPLPACGRVRQSTLPVRKRSRAHRSNLVRAAETIAESRLGAQNRNIQELERLTIGVNEAIYTQFLNGDDQSFSSYPLSERLKMLLASISSPISSADRYPSCRDRRPPGAAPRLRAERGQQTLANIAEIIPLAKQGSLLRAIAHNQAQTSVLGINQLTSGYFVRLEYYWPRKTFPEAEREV